MRLITLVLLTITALAPLTLAFAQTAGFPSRPIRLIVPYPPGGFADLMSRIVALKLNTIYNQQVVVDNRPGAGGHIGAELTIKSPPDGYTIMFGTTTHNATYAMYSKLAYDPPKDLQPVILLAEIQAVLVVHPSLPARNVRDFLSLARARPGQLNYASGGTGSATHIVAELFKAVAKVDMTHIPYKGSGPAMTDLMGGQVDAMFETLPTALPYILGGKIRALGVTSKLRAPILPDVPSIAESGVPGYEAVSYYTISVSSKVPRDIVSKLNIDIDGVLKSPDMVPRWAELGITPLGGPPELAVKRNAVETAMWTKVIRSAGIRAD